MTRPTVGWLSGSLDVAAGGFRFRVGPPVEALRARGHAVEVFDPAAEARYDIVVLAKAYGAQHRELAKRVKARGGRIVFDLCDNHFYNPELQSKYVRARQDILRMLEIADTVICTTPTLAAVIHEETGGRITATVVGDAAETFTGARQVLPSDRLDLLWFGSHGSPNAPSGMTDLLLIEKELSTLSRRMPITLTVCSNNRDKFDAAIAPLPFETRYVAWSPRAQTKALAAAHAVLLPVSLNPFTICKSHNRLTTALNAGRPTIATAIPAYEAFAPYCVLNDFEAGLTALTTDYEAFLAKAALASPVIERDWSMAAMAPLWEIALGLTSARPSTIRSSRTVIHHGHLDAAFGETVTGWVRNPRQPALKPTVLLEQDGHIIARAIANLVRPDLDAVGMPEPDCGFSLDLPSGTSGTLTVRVAEDTLTIGRVSTKDKAGAAVPLTSPIDFPQAPSPVWPTAVSLAEQGKLFDRVRVASESIDDLRRVLARLVVSLADAPDLAESLHNALARAVDDPINDKAPH